MNDKEDYNIIMNDYVSAAFSAFDVIHKSMNISNQKYNEDYYNEIYNHIMNGQFNCALDLMNENESSYIPNLIKVFLEEYKNQNKKND